MAESWSAAATKGGKAGSSGAAAEMGGKAESSGAAAIMGEKAEGSDITAAKGEEAEAPRRAAAEVHTSDDFIMLHHSESIFKDVLISALVESKATSQLERLRLLKWSSRLVKLCMLSEAEFQQIANVQALHCQCLMAGKTRGQRFCKRLFVSLFKSREVLNNYLEVTRVSKFHINAPLFLKLIIDYTVAKFPLYLDYKQVLIDLYTRAIFMSEDEPSEAANVPFEALLVKLGPEDFRNVIFVACMRVLTSNPTATMLHSTKFLLQSLDLDLSDYCYIFMPILLSYARHQDDWKRFNALTIIGELSAKSLRADSLCWMLDTIRAIIGGSEGDLPLPYQRIGMINALEQLSRCPALVWGSDSVRQISMLAPVIASFLITCYRRDGTKEVKLAILVALGSWAKVSADTVQHDLVSFTKSALQKADDLRKGHLELVRVICKQPDSIIKVIPLFDQLMGLVKQGFSDAPKRIDGLYAFFSLLRLASVDNEIAASLWKDDNLWALILGNGPTLISVQLLSELRDEDCLAILDLLHVLLVDQLSRIREYFNIPSLLQLLIHLVCHQKWTVRIAAYNAAKMVLASSTRLAEDILDVFFEWLSLIRQEKQKLEKGDDSINVQQSSIPITEVLIKCLILLGGYVMDGHFPRAYSKLMLCCHHPSVANPNRPASVWKRLIRSLKQQRTRFIDLTSTQSIMNELISYRGRRSDDNISDAIFKSLQTLARMVPSNAARHDQGTEETLLTPNRAPLPTENEPPRMGLLAATNQGTQQAASNAATGPTENLSAAAGSPTDTLEDVLPAGVLSSTSIDQKDRMIPMSDKAFISFLKAAANASVGATTYANIFLATWPLWSDSCNTYNKVALGFTLFIFLPWAVVTAGVAHCAEDDNSWCEYAATMVLIEFTYGFCLGGVAATALPEKAGLVGCFAAVMVMVVVCLWSIVFPHPKWIKRIQFWSPYASIVPQGTAAQEVRQPSFMSKIRKFFKRSEATQRWEGLRIPPLEERQPEHAINM